MNARKKLPPPPPPQQDASGDSSSSYEEDDDEESELSKTVVGAGSPKPKKPISKSTASLPSNPPAKRKAEETGKVTSSPDKKKRKQAAGGSNIGHAVQSLCSPKNPNPPQQDPSNDSSSSESSSASGNSSCGSEESIRKEGQQQGPGNAAGSQQGNCGIASDNTEEKAEEVRKKKIHDDSVQKQAPPAEDGDDEEEDEESEPSKEVAAGSRKPYNRISKYTAEPSSKPPAKHKAEEIGEVRESTTGAIKRLWKQPDELVLLKGLADYRKGTEMSVVALHNSLKKDFQSKYTDTQFLDKMKRLKKKYNANVKKHGDQNPAFSKPHDVELFELSKKVWGDGRDTRVAAKKEGCDDDDDDEVVEFSFDLDMCPDLSMPESVKDVLKKAMGLLGTDKLKEVNRKWKNLQVRESELYLMRLEFTTFLTKLGLETLKSWE